MFGLIKGLWNSFFEKPTIKILIIGLDGSGKTTLLNKLKSLAGQKCLPFDKITPTVGLNRDMFFLILHKPGEYISLFWDLGGQQILRTIWKKYYQDCHGIIFVVDVTDASRLEEAANSLKETIGHKDLGNVPFLILINKIDKGNEEDSNEFELKFTSCLKDLQNREFKIEKVSAFQQSNLTETILWLNSAVFNYYSKNKHVSR